MRKLFLFLFGIILASGALAQPFYVLTPSVSSEKIGCWADAFEKYDEIVGYSSLGHFFMRSSAKGEYMVLHPLKQAAKSYGVFSDVTTFEKSVLQDPGFEAYVLRSLHVAAISKWLGPLKSGEIYIPTPYPFAGGSDKPETYGKGDVWVFMEIVSEMLGICED